MEKIELIRIGYWNNLHSIIDWPSPAWFVDMEWDESIRQKIILHLKNGIKTHSFLGFSWCRFRCGEDLLGASEYTDGKYIWPEGLPHYLEFHNVRLPQQVVDDFLESGKSDIVVDFKNIKGINESYWVQQKGWNPDGKSYKDILDTGVVTIEQIDPTYKLKQEKLLLKFLGKGNGIIKKLYSIDKIINGEKISIKGRFDNYEDFSSLAKNIGLKTSFEQLTYEQYENENRTI